MLWQVLLIGCVAYLVGSLPVGVIVGRLAMGVDIREFGSGKTGFTNSLRTLGLGPSILVLIGDFLKGALPVVLAEVVSGRANLSGRASLEVVAATMAVLGHVLPVLARFKGGRGVTTSFGATATMMPQVGLFLLLVAAAIVYVYRYMSLMSVVGTLTGAILVWALVVSGRVPFAFGIWGIIATSIILVSHRENLQRLRNGTEPKIGQGGQRRTSPGNVNP